MMHPEWQDDEYLMCIV